MASLPPRVRDLPRVFLGQGEVLVTREPLVVQTTLGSCVSVTLRDPISQLAAMSHSVMPEAPVEDAYPLRYTDRATLHLLYLFTQEKIPLSRIEIKIVGGASTPRAVGPPARYRPVGTRNVEVARGLLASKGLRIASADTGGAFGRRVLFVTTTGELFVRALERTNDGSD